MITSPDGSRSGLSRALNLLGVAVVAFFTAQETLPRSDAWVMVVIWLALACWVAVVFMPRRQTVVGSAVLTVMVLAAATVTVPSNGILVVVVAVGLMQLIVDLARPLWQGLVVGIVAVALVPISSLYSPITPLGVVSIEAGIVVALLAGLSRRQFRAAETQARQLLEERIAAREELARATVLASRQQVARDIHDVLAHSLGGLVIQLDAVDALLEAGRTADAAGRVRDARELAASGLAEARRAVDALRDEKAGSRPDTTVGEPSPERAGPLVGQLTALAESHRALGGTIRFTVVGDDDGRMLGPDITEALRRAFQESLTNARKHAPGAPVTAEFRRLPDGAVELRVENALVGSTVPAAPMSSVDVSGSRDPSAPARADEPPRHGHGLQGMAERFGAVRGGDVTAGREDGRFVVLARVAAS